MCIVGACPAQVWGYVCLLSSLIQAPTQALDQGEGNKLLTYGTKCQGDLRNLSCQDKKCCNAVFLKITAIAKTDNEQTVNILNKRRD